MISAINYMIGFLTWLYIFLLVISYINFCVLMFHHKDEVKNTDSLDGVFGN